ncbi:hypothetical protein [Herbiconiux flava]|uniref:DUF11 domain-containing protein n=1 Tax=Herbiconiux flava TaxID=881268 RepID=A0A852SMP5_9MICO|nr:hypothetical protein [Herbiconiux flava]NYD70092.1 hypothetical protein [Herbiconiux flava]GLK16843.1 hypothetical protein GCM10017602_13250 [Herbiconiux flava]
MGRRRLARAAPVTAATVLVALGATALAAMGAPGAIAAGPADDGGVVVSVDGSRYDDAPAEPLFAAPPVIVPGDVVTETLWVRNDGAVPATLRIDATDARATVAAFADALRVSAAIPPLDAGAVPFGDAADCAVLLRGPVLEPGERVAVAVSLSFSAATPDRVGHDARATLDFTASLRDEAAEAAGAGACGAGIAIPGLPDGPASGPGGLLSDTGAAPPLAALLWGAALAVAGALLVSLRIGAARSRRNDPERPR